MRRFLQTAHPVWRVAALVGLLACLVGASAPVQAQELDLAWAVSAGGSGEDYVTRMAADGAGNSYVTGYFTQVATFGSGEAYQITLKNPPGDTYEEMFIAKYDGSGQLVWVTAADTRGTDQVRSTRLVADGAGNSYVLGSCTTGAWCIAKYGDGQLRWVSHISGGVISDMTVDKAGNSYITGNFYTTVVFGGGEAHAMTLTNPQTRDPQNEFRFKTFIAKYDTDGQILWVRQVASVFSPGGGSTTIAVDGAGNSYITGYVRGYMPRYDYFLFSGTATFGVGEANETTLTSMNTMLFVAKYDSNGRLGWVTSAHGTSGVGGWKVAVDRAGNTFVTGSLGGTVIFRSRDAQDITLSPVPGYSSGRFFIAKYEGDGRLRWVRQTGNTSALRIRSIGVDRRGNISILGDFGGSQTFGVGEAHETTLEGENVVGANIFAATYDTDGMLRWARQPGGTGGKQFADAAVDGAGHIYMIGAFYSPTTTFGDDTPSITLVSRARRSWRENKGDIWMAKFLGDAHEEPPEEPYGEPPEEPRAVPPVVVLANTAVTLDRPGPSEGTIWSNGTLQFRPGLADSPSVFTGDLTAVQHMTIHPGNTITGTATAGGLVKVLPGATVTGEVVANAPLTPQPLPQPAFTADGPDQTVPPRGTLALAPGTYGAVTVGKGATLQFHNGEYFLRTLLLGKEAELVVDVTNGPVRLHVVESLDIGKGAQVTLLPADADSTRLHLTTVQTTPLPIRTAAQVVGTLLAPYATVTLGGQSQFTGALMADKVKVGPGAILRPHGASSMP